MLFCLIIRKFCEKLAVEEKPTPTSLDVAVNVICEHREKKYILLSIVLKQKFLE